jgi:hypothetical protein
MEPPTTGTKLTCSTCGTAVVVVRAPSQMPSCCGEPLTGPTSNDKRDAESAR